MPFCTCLFQIYPNHSESHCKVEEMHSCCKSIFSELIKNASKCCQDVQEEADSVPIHRQLLHWGDRWLLWVPFAPRDTPHLPIGNAETRKNQLHLAGSNTEVKVRRAQKVQCRSIVLSRQQLLVDVFAAGFQYNTSQLCSLHCFCQLQSNVNVIFFGRQQIQYGTSFKINNWIPIPEIPETG